MADRRLIEEWLPIAALSEECIRERRSMTALPPTYYLHVWFARRPLVASRAAILGSLLPAGADREKFLWTLGIHGDPLESRRKIARARAQGIRFEGDAYSYSRAFTYLPTEEELKALNVAGSLLDPTAGGGSVPFEAVRLGCGTYANDLNPVAAVVLKATVELPLKHGPALQQRHSELAKCFIARRDAILEEVIPGEPEKGSNATNWLWARTVTCPYCGGLVPLSPNWRLDGEGAGVRLIPEGRRIRFEIVHKASEHSPGTVKDGTGKCPFPDCGREIPDGDIKRQAQAGRMGHQLYCVVYKKEVVVGKLKNGKPKTRLVRGFRAPRPEDDVEALVERRLAGKMPLWQARNIVPDEDRYIGPADRSALYGVLRQVDLFSPRQLYGHCTSVEVFQDMVEELKANNGGQLSELDRAAMVYIALAVDKMLNYNSRMSVWMPTREVVANTFNRHDFAFCWSHAEMAPLIVGLGYDWAIEQTAKCIKELVELIHPEPNRKDDLFSNGASDSEAPSVMITAKSGDALDHIADGTVDVVVMDPPYYDNVMY